MAVSNVRRQNTIHPFYTYIQRIQFDGIVSTSIDDANDTNKRGICAI